MPLIIVTSIAYLAIAAYVFVCARLLNARKRMQRMQRMQRMPSRGETASAAPLPTVQPAWMMDASDRSDACPACYIEHLQRGQLPRHEDGSYLAPAGAPVVCARHQATTLAYAIRVYASEENERKATR